MSAMQQSDRDELHLLYQVTTTDLAYFKSQQWSVTYYCFLVDAGLIGVAQLLKTGASSYERLILAALAMVASVAALVVIWKLENSISVREFRLDSIRKSFGSAFNQAWAAKAKGKEYVHSVFILCGGVIVTTGIAVWLIGWRL